MNPRFSLAELSDHHEIEQLMYTYATGIDTADYELVDSIFVPNGEIDYAGIGGPKGRWNPEIKQWSEESLAAFPVRKHYITNVVVTFAPDRDSATSVTYWRAPMGFARGGRLDPHLRVGRAVPRHVGPHRRRVAHHVAHHRAGLDDRHPARGDDRRIRVTARAARGRRLRSTAR